MGKLTRSHLAKVGALALVTAAFSVGVGVSSASAEELVLDGGFEAADATGDSPNWVEADSVFGTPICTAGSGCGTGGGTATPRSGTAWAWFGGAPGVTNHIGSLTQDVTIPAGTASLTYWLRQGTVGSGDATFEVKVDGAVVDTVPESDTAQAEYAQRTVDLSAHANGAVHTLAFVYTDPTPNGSSLNITLDDVSLGHTAPPPTPTPTPTPTQSPAPAPTPAPADADGDGVPDASDQCPNVAGVGTARVKPGSLAAVSGCPDVQQKVKAKYKNKKQAFSGKVTPKACGASAKVKVYADVPGKDKLVGKATTNAKGKFSIAKSVPDGKYYVTVKKSFRSSAGSCVAGKSKKVTIS